LSKMCDRAIWLDHGQVVAKGSLDKVMTAYNGRTTSPV
jgi:ABC-type polysaccharide/polyol phosphate transport system ATPase subunit